MFHDTYNPAAAYPAIMLYSAITEQPVFVALLRLRFGLPCCLWFRISAVGGVLTKTVVFALTWVVLKKALVDVEITNVSGNGFPWKRAMICIVSIVNVGLFVVQLVSVRIYTILANKSKRSLVAKAGPPTDREPDHDRVEHTSGCIAENC